MTGPQSKALRSLSIRREVNVRTESASTCRRCRNASVGSEPDPAIAFSRCARSQHEFFCIGIILGAAVRLGTLPLAQDAAILGRATDASRTHPPFAIAAIADAKDLRTGSMSVSAQQKSPRFRAF